jgi:alkyldihydroxyacetonephosphate synthase
MLIGSEGILGVITEACVRVQDLWCFKQSASVLFDSFESGARAVRALSQSGLHPSNCRLLDGEEAALTGAVPQMSAGDLRRSGAPRWLQAEGARAALLVVGFESADHELDAWIDRAVELCRSNGGFLRSERGQSRGGSGRPRAGHEEPQGRERPASPESAWRDAFLQAPYLRDTLVAAGIFVETYETAVTWERLDGLVATVRERIREALGGDGTVTCRLTHVYPDGAAPYFTVLAPARRGDELAQWEEVKAAASEAIAAGGGTITHHHAVGRDHRPWYDRQRPDPFAAGLRAAKAAVDPAGILNPGVLIDP